MNLLKELQIAFSKPVTDCVIELDNFLTNRSSFNILRLEDLYEKTNGNIPPFRHSDYLILFVKKGTGKRSIGHNTVTIQDSSLAIIPRRVIHSAVYTNQPFGYLICFHPDFFLQQAFSYKLLNSKRVLHSSLSPFIVVSEEQGAEISSIFEKINEECNNAFDEKKQMIALKVLELLILCERFFTKKVGVAVTTGHSDLLQQFHELIENNFFKKKDVRFYAYAMHTHPNNLNHIVKKATGITAKQTIMNRLIMEAKYLLASTKLPIKEISYQLGFEDPNYFISFFKKDLHTTPLKYRNQFV